ncbi:hypothetical protein, partial [Streptococcus pyogenes]|uniref:hypothetical protein n=1 Tax=Streptococcus pyogenes TaxID=1314 RepID=UPI001CA31AF0
YPFIYWFMAFTAGSVLISVSIFLLFLFLPPSSFSFLLFFSFPSFLFSPPFSFPSLSFLYSPSFLLSSSSSSPFSLDQLFVFINPCLFPFLLL